MVPFEYSAEYSILHACQETTRGLTRNHTKGFKETLLVLNTGLGIVPVPTNWATNVQDL